MRKLHVLVAGLVIAAAACSSSHDGPTDAPDDASRQQAVTASLDGVTLVIRNDADFAVRVAVLESDWATNGLALWCFGSDECGARIAAHGTLRVPLAEVDGYAPGREEVLVHWWNPADPERQPGEGAPVRKFPVRLGG